MSTRIWKYSRSQLGDQSEAVDPTETNRSLMVVLESLVSAATIEAEKLNNKSIGTEHLLLAALAMASDDLMVVLREYSVTYEAVLAKVVEIQTRQ